jgi:hypothetical protein
MTDLAEVILFLHIPKTAGSTVQVFFEQQMRPSQWFTLSSPDPFAEYANLPAEVKRTHRVVKGHMPFGIHATIARPTQYVTVVRDPIDRIVSNYYYTRTYPAHYLYREATRMTLEEFATSRLSVEMDNLQVRLLAGCPDQPYGTLGAAELERAKAHLESHFAVVGHQGDLPAFFTAVSKRFGLRNIGVRPENVTPQRPTLAEIPSGVKQAIERQNELDVELYRFVMKTQPERFRWRSLVARFGRKQGPAAASLPQFAGTK